MASGEEPELVSVTGTGAVGRPTVAVPKATLLVESATAMLTAVA